MKLSQHATFKNFYLPAEETGFFVFSTKEAGPQFDFEKAFNVYEFVFLIVFYKDDQLVINEPLREKLQGAAQVRGIYWVDQLSGSRINGCPAILFSSPNQTLGFSNMVFGQDSSGSRVILHSEGSSTVVFNPTDATMVFSVVGTEKYKMRATVGQENEFSVYVIPLRHQTHLFGFAPQATGNNAGYLCFQMAPKPAGSIQPRTALLSAGPEGGNYLHSYHYFDDESYGKDIDAVALINPCQQENFNNSEAWKFGSYLELFIRQGAKTNFIDELGNNFRLTAPISLVSRLAFVDPNEADPSAPNFFFTPKAGQTLNLSAPGQYLLMGNSGTERQDKATLVFQELEEVLYKENSAGALENSKYGGSRTSIAVSEPSDGSRKYYIDSERKSLFDNNSHAKSAQNNLETPYMAIQVGAIKLNAKVPFIPTLSFKPGSDLENLEKLLVRSRLSHHMPRVGFVSHLDNGRFVTPQGFTRNGQKLSFIRPSDDKQFTFDIDNVLMTSDFNMSISKEDVFLVLTPSMLKGPETFAVRFSVRGFIVDLVDFNKANPDGKDTFIIFKFRQQSFTSLLNDPVKWSNYAGYRPDAALAAELTKGIKEKIKFPSNDDYKYFNETILADPNWNGVLVLNIPIGNGKNLPPIFDGLSASQELDANAAAKPVDKPKVRLKTGMKFQYMAFGLNKTQIADGAIEIGATSFNGIIDYDLLNKPNGDISEDYAAVSRHFPKDDDDVEEHRFLLTKLLVRFENSTIKNFKSFAFLQLPKIFENTVKFGSLPLAHPGMQGPDTKAKLVRLEGQYQKNSAGNDEFNFFAQAKISIDFEEGSILKQISVSRLGFSYSPGTKEFRFDINAGAELGSWSNTEFFSIQKLDFENIGFKFKLQDDKFPSLIFDLSKLLVFPEINFDGKGFLSSFPIKFSHFQMFKFKMAMIDGKLGFSFLNGDFDFFKLPESKTGRLMENEEGSLFSFVFDFDLGTLGSLEALKALKGKLLIGWSMKGGFLMGFKLDGPSSDGLHLNLFGALKIDIADVAFGKFKPPGSAECSAFFLRLNDARLTIFGKELPGEENAFNGIIIAQPKKSIAWLINYDNQETGELVLGVGQRMGPPLDESVSSTVDAINATRDTFKTKLKGIDGCTDPKFFEKINFRPERNWLLASEAILPKDWPVDLKFIFNDPVLYGIYVGLKGEFLKGFRIDILYKKLAENLGVYSTEIQLSDSIRSMDLGGAFIRLPNIGVDIFTNGDWKVDIGFPTNSNDWSRSGFIQLRTTPPFVGFFGLYMKVSKIASLTLFNRYIRDNYSKQHLRIVQAGFAMRVGIGFYYDKGILYVGASITVYGILEGAFAFEKEKGLAMLFPDHFALLGRFGALAELVGYVDFGIIKASVYVSLRAEFVILMVYIGRDGVPGENTGKGIQPVRMYVEGEVRVAVAIEIGCVTIRLRFRMFLRFEYAIGGGGGSRSSLTGLAGMELPSAFAALQTPVIPVRILGIKNIPMVYLPAFSKIKEGGVEQLVMMHVFMIPLFGKKLEDSGIKLPDTNLFKDKIIKPFFQDLIAQLEGNGIKDPDKYETLRSVLLNGHCHRLADGERVKIEIQMAEYVPTFINGINSSEKGTVDKVLKNFFGFTDAELKGPSADDSIAAAYREELLLIPAPVAKRVQIVNADNAVIHNALQGFSLKVDGLVNDVAGNPSIVTGIGALTNYDDTTLEWMERFYDEYKIQFINRKQQNEGFALAPKDLREAVIIPQFFKLTALLMLEAFYAANNPRQKHKEYNPKIQILEDGQFSLPQGKWNPNDAIEQVVGQLNYFYNSGLRLPFQVGNESTEAIYEILKQRVPISYKPDAASHLAEIKVSIDDKDITADVFANDDAKRDMVRFVEGFERAFSLGKLRDEFPAANPIRFTRPFDLVPVTLAVQYNQIGKKDEFRFLDIPAKLAQHGRPGNLYSFELNYANYSKQEGGKDVVELSSKLGLPGLSLLKCINLEIKVRKHTDKVLEITGVYTKDLNLASALFNDTYALNAIDLYYKPETDASDPAAATEVTRLIDAFTTVLKTNLSPRTSPPLFEPDLFGFDNASLPAGKEYWDDSNSPDKKNFIRLVWEALTTNNGGYYFILDKESKFPNDASGKELSTGTVILSLSGAQAKVPAYFNSIKLSGPKELFAGLEARTHYLYIDSIKLSDGVVVDKEVLEYHPRIPAHTMGFEVGRDRTKLPKRNYRNYIPLEFAIQKADGAFVLSANKVLPLMPLGEKENELRYHHLTPLVTQVQAADPLGKNLSRYSAVGEKYRVSINVRDVFGARTSDINTFIATTEYEHCYFDKLTPIDAWPLVKFSYWFNEFASGKLVFEVSCNCDILEVLDLAGIERKPNGDYAYRLGQVIDGSNTNDPRTHVARLKELVPGLLNNLYTILAQLTDAKTFAVIHGAEVPDQKEAWRQKIEDLVDKLTRIITSQADGKYRMPDKQVIATKAYRVMVAPAGGVKQELAIEAGLLRKGKFIHNADESTYTQQPGALPLTELNSPYVWDYQSTLHTITRLKLLNPAKPGNSKLKDLDGEIIAKTQKAFCLGISSELRRHPDTGEQLNEKAIYLINRALLSVLKLENANAGKEISEKCYFGIAPISNKLWSGEYKPSGGLPAESFSNIDLDKALRLVLDRIDHLLQAKKLSKEINSTEAGGNDIKELFNQLVDAKKKLVEKKLQQQLDWVMDEQNKPQPGPGLIQEFRDLLLGGLNNFYTYDGVVKTSMSGVGALDEHRLTISLDAPKGTVQNAQYNLLGSKVSAANREWYILFDQKENVVDRVNFEIRPVITHIEFDIRNPGSSEIERSTWIQLINSIPLADEKYFVRDWPKITREFPARPAITKHASEQVLPDDPKRVEHWDAAQLGLWNYQLAVNGDAYLLDDIIHVDLMIETAANSSAFEAGASFEGFVAYWASRILDSQFDAQWRDFVRDFSTLFESSPFVTGNASSQTRQYSFELRKLANGEWKIENQSDPALKVEFPKDMYGNDIKTSPAVIVGPFNIFDKSNRVVMILPRGKVFRNRDVKNTVFRYETETVEATSPAIPHIKFFTPLALKPGETFGEKVFGTAAHPVIPADSPFKATAKYLVNSAGNNAAGANRFPMEIKTLPVIPVRQVECKNGAQPTATDQLFNSYDKKNGFPAFSLTIYGDPKLEGNLPVFYADNIFRSE